MESGRGGANKTAILVRDQNNFMQMRKQNIYPEPREIDYWLGMHNKPLGLNDNTRSNDACPLENIKSGARHLTNDNEQLTYFWTANWINVWIAPIWPLN